MSAPDKKVIVIGAGPAGLTAAYQLSKAGVPSVVLEKDRVVGGLCRTVNYKGFLFDIGGHRFFTKVKVVEDLWREILGEADFVPRRRLSRIHYNGRLFYYPLRFWNALFGLGFWNSLLILLSYFKAQLFPEKPEETFETWVSNRFGERLYRIFFKTYTEKVWGIPCSEITADWAAQRIKGLSLLQALKSILIKQERRDKNAVIKTLIDSFHYPTRGPGMMWEKAARLAEDRGSSVRLGVQIEKIFHSGTRVEVVEILADGRRERVPGSHFISSMPIRELIGRLEPAAPLEVHRAARSLHYRDFIVVALIANRSEVFPDNWIYIHEPGARVGRIQNFKNWSPEMVPDAAKTCLGLEYFCFEGDELWTLSDHDLIELGKKELERLGLVRAEEIEDGAVVRVHKAYPVYDSSYQESLRIIREFLAPIANLQLVGRNGMHKYNNQDHAMLTAMLAVENILGAHHDLWKVNVDQEYHEEVRERSGAEEKELALLASTQPRVPQLRSSRHPAAEPMPNPRAPRGEPS